MEIQIVTVTALKPSVPKQLPPPNSDFYHSAETLSADELAILKQARAFMETKVAPVVNKYWVEDAFPFELLPVQGAEPRALTTVALDNTDSCRDLHRARDQRLSAGRVLIGCHLVT
jgi:hypothetical protein